MSTQQSPISKLERVYTMPEKFVSVKAIIEKTGTEYHKKLVTLAGEYIAGLNNMFYDREVTEFMLKEFDFPMFFKELEHQHLLEGLGKFEIMFLTMNVKHIVRHTWELTGENGKPKNGNDLRKAWRLMWEDDQPIDIEQLVRDVATMK